MRTYQQLAPDRASRQWHLYELAFLLSLGLASTLYLLFDLGYVCVKLGLVDLDLLLAGSPLLRCGVRGINDFFDELRFSSDHFGLSATTLRLLRDTRLWYVGAFLYARSLTLLGRRLGIWTAIPCVVLQSGAKEIVRRRRKRRVVLLNDGRRPPLRHGVQV